MDLYDLTTGQLKFSLNIVNGRAGTIQIVRGTSYLAVIRQNESAQLGGNGGRRPNNPNIYVPPVPHNTFRNSQIINIGDGSITDFNIYWNKYSNPTYTGRWDEIKAVVAANKAAGHITNYDTVTPVSGFGSDCVLLKDGRVLSITAGSPLAFGIFNPVDNSWITFGQATFAMTFSYVWSESGTYQYPVLDESPVSGHQRVFDINDTFSSATLLENGDVIAVPHTSQSYFAYIDIANLNVIPFIAPEISHEGGNRNYQSSLLLSNGNLLAHNILPEGNATYLPIYFSPDKDNISKLSYQSTIGDDYYSYIEVNSLEAPIYMDSDAINLANGGFLMTVHGSYYEAPNFNKLSLFNGAAMIAQFGTDYSATMSGMVFLDNDKVWIFNNDLGKHAIADPATLTMSATTGNFPGERGGHLLPDGRILTYDFHLYNYMNQSYTSMTGANGLMASMRMLPDGRIYALTNTGAQIISASDGNYGETYSLEMCISAFLNNK